LLTFKSKQQLIHGQQMLSIQFTYTMLVNVAVVLN